jgi:hypothetical protein
VTIYLEWNSFRLVSIFMASAQEIALSDLNIRGYAALDRQQAKPVLHMLKLRLVHAAEAVFLFVVDSDPYQGREAI